MSAPMPVAVRAQARPTNPPETVTSCMTSTTMRLQHAGEDRRPGAPAPASAKEAPAPGAPEKERKKSKMQQVEEELANAELEREQLKIEQTLLDENMIILLSNRHIPVVGWSHVPPTGGSDSINTPMTSQSFSFFAQAAALASSAYGPGPLRPRVRNTPLLAEGCGAANFLCC
jgi:hypothetical protein